MIQRPKKQKPWKEGELRMMLKYCGVKPIAEITDLLNAEFKNKRTPSSVEARGHKNGFIFRLKTV